jgi:hypothetical protein
MKERIKRRTGILVNRSVEMRVSTHRGSEQVEYAMLPIYWEVHQRNGARRRTGYRGIHTQRMSGFYRTTTEFEIY